MPVFNFKVPRRRCKLFQAQPEFSSTNPITERLVQTRDMFLNVAFGRIAATDNNNYELEAKYYPDVNCLEMDVPPHVLEFLTDVQIGPNFRCFLDWLNGLKDADVTGIDPGPGPGGGATGSTGPTGPPGTVGGPTGSTGPTGVGGGGAFRVPFTISDWDSGVPNEITIIQSGIPGPGEIGPHSFTIEESYVISAYRDSDDELVDVGIVVDPITGNVTLTKTGLAAAFDGRAIMVDSGDGDVGSTGSTGNTGNTGPTGTFIGPSTFRTDFVASDWTSGTANEITIIRAGALAAGEIGPHNLPIEDIYVVQVATDSTDETVDVSTEFNTVTGDVILRKSPLAPNFDGRIIIVASTGLGPIGPVGPTGASGTGPTGPPGPGGVKSIPFITTDWSSGTVDEITIPKSGPLLAGEIGPHVLVSDGPYLVQIFKEDSINVNIVEEVDMKVITDTSDGTIILRKGGVTTNFDGYVIVSEPT